MTERGRRALDRTATRLSIGPSELRWRDNVLTIDFDELAAPIPSRLRGTIILVPAVALTQAYDLDGRGRHVWRPIAPRADVTVALSDSSAVWQGSGYFDSNTGREPVESGFSAWTWSRAHLPEETRLFYDVTLRDGERGHLALMLGADGRLQSYDPLPPAPLPTTFWRVPRAARPLAEAGPTVVRTLEDTPFYARSQLQDRCNGETADVIHESLLATRLRSPLVRAMLPFRMPRAFW